MSEAAGQVPLGPLLDELQAGLEALLACFETRRFPEQAAMEAAWLRVQRSFDRVSERLGPTPEAGTGRDALQERVNHCLRLYAVAAGVLMQRRSELAAERSALSDARQRLRHVRSEGPRGGSCDVSA